MKSTQSKKVKALLKESCLLNNDTVVVVATSKKSGKQYFEHKTLEEWFEMSVLNENNVNYYYHAEQLTFAQNNQQYAHWLKTQKK